MMRIHILVILLTCMFTTTATGMEMEFQVVGLEGAYDDIYAQPWPEKETSFDIGSFPPFRVNNAYFRILGTATIVESWCNPWWSDPFPGSFNFIVEIPDTVSGGIWSAEIKVTESGAFDISAPFTTVSGALWEFFEETGVLDITLSGGGCPSCFELYSGCSDAIVTETYLILDLDFSVSTSGNTWGSIKSLYR